MVVKMFALYFVCVACDVGRPVHISNRLVKLSIECNTVDIHTYIHTYIHK